MPKPASPRWRSIALAAGVFVAAAPRVSLAQQHSTRRDQRAPDPVYEATITDLQSAMAAGTLTSVELVDAYLARIDAYDHRGPTLNAVVRLNPHARADAAARDAERKAGRVRGPLHGIPIILKDNYGTTDMLTSAGSIALAGMQTPGDAFQVRKLREAGAVIIGKSNMHELASGITTISSIGGQTCNPYDPDRNPGGSSGGSGAAVAASFAAVAWGSDTCGSIRIPSAVHNLVGLRPTKGLSSTAGIVPLSHSQDVGGPIARTVRDLAIALDATVGADPADTATRILGGNGAPSFVAALDPGALRGKRIGVFTDYFGTDGEEQETGRVVRAALAEMKKRGADVVDITIPTLDSIVNKASVIIYEFKYDLIDYLATIPDAPVKSLGEALDRGLYSIQLEANLRGRERDGTRNGAEYLAALQRRTMARGMVTAYLDSAHLDAIAYPTLRRKTALIGEPQRGTTCALSAVTGLPALALPAGFTADGLPIGFELLGRPLSDAKLVGMAYDYEQATHPRRPPSTTPALVGGRAPAPVSFVVAARDGAVAAKGAFVFDETRRTLVYDVAVSGVSPSRVYGLSIDRDSAGRNGPVFRTLVGPGHDRAKGTLTLGSVERRELAAGQLAFVVYTADRPFGTIKARMALAAAR